MHCSIPLTLALAGLSTAHFVLQWPTSAGFDEDQEPNGPCGGQTVTVSNDSTKINVDRFAISIKVGHPTGAFAFRATTDTSPPYNFTDITQIINSTNIGTFCANYMHAPSSFAGKAGIIQVIDQSVDGTLYQCAPVNFVSGSNDTLGSACTNITTTLQWSSAQDTFASNSAAASGTPATSSAPAASGAAASSGTKSGMAALATVGIEHLAGLGMVAAGLLI